MRCLIALTLLVHYGVVAQSELFWAIPTPGPPTTIHHSADSASAVIARITSDDVLLVRYEGANWCWVQDALGQQGYLQRALVLPLTKLDDKSAARWMLAVFQEEARLGRQVNERYLAGDTLGAQAAGRALNAHEYERNAAHALFTGYFCRTGDRSLLREMMASVSANFGSASEEPPYRLTLALECRPGEFKKTLASFSGNDAGILIEATSNGIWLRFDENDPEQQRQGDALMKLLHE